jgi:N-acetylneuraminic acid mutarotase
MGGPQVTQIGTISSGSYGNKGVGSARNLPSGRDSAVTWTDSSGSFWLFGGEGYDSVGSWGDLNDLWKYSNGQWTWVSGSNLSEQVGVYGTIGVSAPANIPSGRSGAVGWQDSSGNLWLFGGLSTSAGAADLLNDLWKYSNGQWTWVSGSNQPNQQGVFGTQGVPSSANAPGARSDAATWVDSAGNFWLYSGYSATASNHANEPDDLWKYSSGQWTWVGGSQGISPGTYGTGGLASPTNIPGSRMRSAAWADTSGRLWVFGGEGYGASLPYGYLNDLWMYQP